MCIYKEKIMTSNSHDADDDAVKNKLKKITQHWGKQYFLVIFINPRIIIIIFFFFCFCFSVV